MVTIAYAAALTQAPGAPPDTSGMSPGALGTLAVVGGLFWWFLKVQRDPLRRCGRCPKPKADGSYHRCRHCGGNPERLKTAAWVFLQLGIPVPRARRYTDRRARMAVPKDYTRDD
jgi:hypothetical protein